MIVPLVFAYRADCIPSKGRKVRRMRFLDRIIVQIEEFATSEAPVAFRTPTAHRGADETFAIGGRFFRALRTADGSHEMELQPFLDELALDAGNHTLMDNDQRRIIPDVLGLRRIAELRQPLPEEAWPVREFDGECYWPSKRIEEVALRRIVENFHDRDAASVARAAARIAIVNGRPFVESGEPIWRLRLIGYPDGRTQTVRLSIMSNRELCGDLEGKESAIVPFADYRHHRLNRTADLIDEIRLLDHYCAPDGAAEALAFAERTAMEILPAADTFLDLTTPMLADLALRTHSTAVRMSTEEREGGGLFITVAQALKGYEPPRPGAHAIEIGACLRDLHARLTDRSVKQPPHGGLNRHLNAITPALRRLERDLAEGLIEAPALDGADDEALGSLV
jgi:hypothetical protein